MSPSKKRPQEPKSVSLYREGAIMLRSDEFWKQVSLFILPQSDEGLLKKRIEACIPRGSSITCLHASDNATYFSTALWQAKFVCVEATEERRAYEFWFSDPRKSTDVTVLLQMNILATAIEKAFLLTNIYTVHQLRYATKKDRAFDIGMSSKRETGILDIAEWVEVTNPVFLSLKAIEIGSHSLKRVIDASMVGELNNELAIARSELLVMRFIDTPALPPKIRKEAEVLFSNGVGKVKDQDSEPNPAETASSEIEPEAMLEEPLDEVTTSKTEPEEMLAESSDENAPSEAATSEATIDEIVPEMLPVKSSNETTSSETDGKDVPAESLEKERPDQENETITDGLCTSCGHQNRPGALFCVGCGKPMNSGKDDDEEGRDG